MVKIRYDLQLGKFPSFLIIYCLELRAWLQNDIIRKLILNITMDIVCYPLNRMSHCFQLIECDNDAQRIMREGNQKNIWFFQQTTRYAFVKIVALKVMMLCTCPHFILPYVSQFSIRY